MNFSFQWRPLASQLTLALALLAVQGPAWAQKKAAKADQPVYKDASQSIEKRVADLLGRMTLEEKIGQMTQIATTEINTVTDPKNKAERFQPYLAKDKAAKFIKEHKVGSFLAAFAVPPAQWVKFMNELQEVNMKESRLQIPIIYGNDHVHGANYVTGATIFPQPFNLGNTFNVAYAEAMGAVTAREIAYLGQHWNFAPILDVGRNPYWPRQYETFGEDPHLIGQMGAAYIRALQNEPGAAPYKVAATAKHFLGYSDPKSGWDRASAVIPDQELREIFLPPFREAVKAGVKTFMINSGEVNGVPVHASAKLLNGLLRKELGFRGVIVTDWADILQLIGEHKVAHNEKEATRMALLAGIDMSMTATSTGFCKVTKELVEEGSVPMEVIDTACARILRLKFDLGLFEHPYPSALKIKEVGSPANRALAQAAARESIVLLKNNGLLPLIKPGTILVAGLTASNKRNISGGWTIEWSGAPESRFPADQETVFTALKKEFASSTVLLADSFAKPAHRQQFTDQAAKADVIVMAVGEEPYAEGGGNINDLRLPQDQIDWIKAAQATGKPVVLVMLAGRPRVITDVIEGCKAFIFAGLPSIEGAPALAEIISGKTNPSGKLAISYPRFVGHNLPYNAKVHDRLSHLYTFGSGLSYTSFDYSGLTLSDTIINRNQAITAKVTVTNKGARAGKEAVLWFLRDEVRTITPLMRKLAHFEKMDLKPGESKTLSFVINPSQHLAFPDEHGRQLLEAGYFELQVGGQKRRFQLRTKGQGSTEGGDTGSYLQIDLVN